MIERMKKLMELASRGVGGEKANAREMLERAMRKYGVTESDLGSDERTHRAYKFNGKFQRGLLIQIIAFTCGASIKIFGSKRSASEVIIEASANEHIEIELLFDAHKKSFDKQCLVFLRAYIHKNQLYPRDSEESDKEYTREEIDELRKMAKMMEGVERTHVRKQIAL
jgi:hypothetical protein